MKKVIIEMENGEVMTGELYEDIAPITVENFEKLANDGFYDGLTAGFLRYILYHRRYPHLFIEPPQTELLPLPRAGVKEPVEPYRSPSSGPKWNMKNMLDKIRENIKDLF